MPRTDKTNKTNVCVCVCVCERERERERELVPKQGGAEGARPRASAREAEDGSWWRRGGTGGGVAVAEEAAADGAGGESRKSIGERLGMVARRPVCT